MPGENEIGRRAHAGSAIDAFSGEKRKPVMKRFSWTTRTAVGLALVGMLFPQQRVLAQNPVSRPAAAAPAEPAAAASPALEIVDVALSAGGGFSGQVVDGQGRPLGNTAVMVCQQQKVAATTTTDGSGRFTVHGLQGGMYQVASGQGVKNCRLWADGTAPPAAQNSALVVSSGQIVRGQGGLRYWLTNPWVLSIAVAAAIAVPIALSNRSKAQTS